MVRSFKQWLVILLFAILAQSAPIDSGVEDGDVPPSVTPEEFAALKGTYFVKFFSPSCSHCRALAPKWDAAYRDVGGPNSKGFKWANVNCQVYSDFCHESSITGYPTLRIYRDGQRIYDYKNSGPSELDLQSFAKKYVEIGDKAFASEHELASKQAVDLATAEQDKDTAAQAAEAKKSVSENSAAKPAGTPAGTSAQPPAQPPADAAAGAAAAAAAAAEPAEPAAPAAPAEPAPAPAAEGAENAASSTVTLLHAGDFGADRNVGRWFVLFTGPDCDECDSLMQKWEKHENFARSIDGINWGRVDCAADEALCEMEDVANVPVIRLYQDGIQVFDYKGQRDTMALRKFLLHASKATSFAGFSLSDLDTPGSVSNPDSQLEGASPNQEPKYLEGPVVQRPNYGDKKPKISDVVKYTLDTLGQPIDQDPGKLIFGDSPEAHHNFRTWGAPNAPPPPYLEPGSAATHADGRVREINGDEFETVVKASAEPWLVKFYSPACQYCVSMAKAYEDVAVEVKGKINVAAVNCETNRKVCDAENVKFWPHIVLYRGAVALEPFTGSRTSNEMVQYTQKAYESQIFPVGDELRLQEEIVMNMDHNVTTFLYLYDQSVMAEDWDSLQKVAAGIKGWGGKIYRSNSEELRELAGIKHRGTAFVNVDLIGTPGEGALRWYDYPWSNIPKKIRDVEEVSKWAYRAKWSLLQYLDPAAQTQYSPYVAVLLTDGVTIPSEDKNVSEHHLKALELRDFYIQRQIEDQDKLRIDRLRQHDQALVENKFQEARYLMRQPIETPVRVDLAFAHIPHARWVEQYKNYVDVDKHKVGNVIILDFYNGIYVDEFNLMPIRDERNVLDDVVELLRRFQVKDPKTTFRSIRHFKTSMPHIPEPEHRPRHFHALPYQKKSSLFSSVSTLIKVVIFTAIAYAVYAKLLRPKLRAFLSRTRARRNKKYSSL